MTDEALCVLAILQRIEEDLDYLDDRPDYSKLGVKAIHIDALIEIACNMDLHASEDRLEYAAPIYAVSALGQLNASQAVEPLFKFVPELYAKDAGTDWFWAEFQEMLRELGPAILPLLADYLTRTYFDAHSRMLCGTAIGRIATSHPDSKASAIASFMRQLEQAAGDDRGVNANVIYELGHFQVQEAYPLIKAAYEGGWVDQMFCGPLERIEFDLGMRDEPPPSFRPLYPLWDSPGINRSFDKEGARKKKAKRKQAKASRRRNRK